MLSRAHSMLFHAIASHAHRFQLSRSLFFPPFSTPEAAQWYCQIFTHVITLPEYCEQHVTTRFLRYTRVQSYRQKHTHAVCVCMDLCESVRGYISEATCLNFNFLCLLFMSLASFSSGVIAISYVLWCHGRHHVFLQRILWRRVINSSSLAAMSVLPNTPATSYSLRPVLDDGEWRVGRARNAGAEYVMYRYHVHSVSLKFDNHSRHNTIGQCSAHLAWHCDNVITIVHVDQISRLSRTTPRRTNIVLETKFNIESLLSTLFHCSTPSVCLSVYVTLRPSQWKKRIIFLTVW